MTKLQTLAVLALGFGVANFFSIQVEAAIPKTPLHHEVSSIKTSDTGEALRLPLGERLSALQMQGPQGYRNLRQIMFDEKQGMEARWRSVIAAGMIGGTESKPELEQALKSREWFMRNAGLLAMVKADRAAAIKWARILLSDKAMVVRAAAVDVLGDLKDPSSLNLLWTKLNAKENFKGKQSLFIRRRIIETLAAQEVQGREAKFVSVLADQDESLHAPAIQALERLTAKTMGVPQEPVKFKKAHWQRWWKEKNESASM